MSPDPTALTTGAFRAATGLSVKALRLYDSTGLLPPAEVDRHTGYRYYAPSQVERAQRIALLRQAGMPLARIAAVLDTSADEAVVLLERWWAEQVADARRREGVVAYLRDELVERPAPGHSVRSRHVPERTVATLTAHVTQPDLVETIIALRSRLRAHLSEGGTRHTDEHWVIYHGAVTPDSDGPVEVCVPYSGSAAPGADVVLRVEPAHEVAGVELTADQCAYPQILHAYAAVDRWVAGHGQPVGAPREIYPVPWDDSPDAGTVAEVMRPYRVDSAPGAALSVQG